MNRDFTAYFIGVIAICLGCYVCGQCTGCSAAQNHVVAQDVLTASQILCVLASNFTDDAAVAEACAIDKVLVPLVRPFLAQKEATAAAAVTHARVQRCSDAGAR